MPPTQLHTRPDHPASGARHRRSGPSSDGVPTSGRREGAVPIATRPGSSARPAALTSSDRGLPGRAHAGCRWNAYGSAVRPSVSATTAPRLPISRCGGSVVSSAVWRSISALSAAPAMMIRTEIHTQNRKPTRAPSEP